MLLTSGTEFVSRSRPAAPPMLATYALHRASQHHENRQVTLRSRHRCTDTSALNHANSASGSSPRPAPVAKSLSKIRASCSHAPKTPEGGSSGFRRSHPPHAPGSEPVTDTNFAARLVAARKSHSLTQQQLAEHSGAHVTRSAALKPAPASPPSTYSARSRSTSALTRSSSTTTKAAPRARPCGSNSKPSTSSPEEQEHVAAFIEGALLRHHARSLQRTGHLTTWLPGATPPPIRQRTTSTACSARHSGSLNSSSTRTASSTRTRSWSTPMVSSGWSPQTPHRRPESAADLITTLIAALSTIERTCARPRSSPTSASRSSAATPSASPGTCRKRRPHGASAVSDSTVSAVGID